jgi:hypothetical protein
MLAAIVSKQKTSDTLSEVIANKRTQLTSPIAEASQTITSDTIHPCSKTQCAYRVSSSCHSLVGWFGRRSGIHLSSSNGSQHPTLCIVLCVSPIVFSLCYPIRLVVCVFSLAFSRLVSQVFSFLFGLAAHMSHLTNAGLAYTCELV